MMGLPWAGPGQAACPGPGPARSREDRRAAARCNVAIAPAKPHRAHRCTAARASERCRVPPPTAAAQLIDPSTGTMDAAAERLCIPVQESDEVVVVPVGQLPDPQEVLNVLISEAAVLPLWLDFARTYLQQGDVEGFQKILQEASSEEVLTEVEQYFGKKPNYEHIQCLCGFMALHLARANDEKDRQKRVELLNTAKQFVLKAKQVDPREQLPDIAAGMLALARVRSAAAAARSAPGTRGQPRICCGARAPQTSPHAAIAPAAETHLISPAARPGGSQEGVRGGLGQDEQRQAEHLGSAGAGAGALPHAAVSAGAQAVSPGAGIAGWRQSIAVLPSAASWPLPPRGFVQLM